MNISIRAKKKVTGMTNPNPIVVVREEIRLSELVDYHLLICRL